MGKKIGILMMVILFSSIAAAVHASGTSSSSSMWGSKDSEEKKEADERKEPDERKTPEKSPAVSLYDQGVEASKINDFQTSRALFEQALQQDPGNPDIINELAHSQRKLGMIDESLENYKKALALRPRFPEAREYLGEAYIQAAVREITTLRSYGSEGAENLEDLTKAFKAEAANLE
jgi:tetratricopeptide (TPR) repeat protein